MSKELNIVYIDDKIETELSAFLERLENEIKYKDYSYKTYEISFQSKEDTYITLLQKEVVKKADIIIIDSRLFDDSSNLEERLSGEEFSLILQNHFSYKKVIIITQNEIQSAFGQLKKWDTDLGISAYDYYSKDLFQNP